MLFEFECTSLSQSLKLAIHIWTGFIHCGKMLYFSILSWVLHCFYLILEAPSVKLLICKACLTTLNTIPAQHCRSSVKKVTPSDCSEMCIPLLDFTVPWTDKTLAKYCCLLIWKNLHAFSDQSIWVWIENLFFLDACLFRNNKLV